jgi:hypothetical protein
MAQTSAIPGLPASWRTFRQLRSRASLHAGRLLPYAVHLWEVSSRTERCPPLRNLRKERCPIPDYRLWPSLWAASRWWRSSRCRTTGLTRYPPGSRAAASPGPPATRVCGANPPPENAHHRAARNPAPNPARAWPFPGSALPASTAKVFNRFVAATAKPIRATASGVPIASRNCTMESVDGYQSRIASD